VSQSLQPRQTPEDKRAIVAVDLGAESCRVSLLRWRGDTPEITLVHRFANGPYENDGLRWPLANIERGIDEGLRRCATLAPEGIRSIAVDGWAVDYVRIDAGGKPLAEPFCYRDQRTHFAFDNLHRKLPPARLQQITGVQLSPIDTLYQLCADATAGLDPGERWLNLPEYMLTRWGGEAVAEYTNATHSQMIDRHTGAWSDEVFTAAGLDIHRAPRIVASGTRIGRVTGPLAELAAFHDTQLIAPACHDTASAIAGIPYIHGSAYISCGTWSLIGTLLPSACAAPAALDEGFTNLGAVGGQICLHKSVSGMWLLKQCIEMWSTAGGRWSVEELIAAAQSLPAPASLLDVDDPDLVLIGDMPRRINRQRERHGLPALDESPSAAPHMAALIFHSLAAKYADTLDRVEHHTGQKLREVVIVGGGSRNDLLCRLTAERSGRTVRRGSAESSTIGNFAVQLATLERPSHANDADFAKAVSTWASLLLYDDVKLAPVKSAVKEAQPCSDAIC
jgi:rhamnulokinase